MRSVFIAASVVNRFDVCSHFVSLSSRHWGGGRDVFANERFFRPTSRSKYSQYGASVCLARVVFSLFWNDLVSC